MQVGYVEEPPLATSFSHWGPVIFARSSRHTRLSTCQTGWRLFGELQFSSLAKNYNSDLRSLFWLGHSTKPEPELFLKGKPRLHSQVSCRREQGFLPGLPCIWFHPSSLTLISVSSLLMKSIPVLPLPLKHHQRATTTIHASLSERCFRGDEQCLVSTRRKYVDILCRFMLSSSY